ncbi:hypothetical protein [Colwellia sp. KU-HH00111]
MNKLIAYIKSTFRTEANPIEQLSCNYANNYYGDQCCQAKQLVNEKRT